MDHLPVRGWIRRWRRGHIDRRITPTWLRRATIRRGTQEQHVALPVPEMNGRITNLRLMRDEVGIGSSATITQIPRR